jgi:hypothetical protein
VPIGAFGLKQGGNGEVGIPMLDCSWLLPTVRAGLLVLGTLPGGLVAQAQESPCDTSLARLSPGPQGYRLHGDRCEGTFIQPVAGTALWLASLTESFEKYDLGSRADLILDWSSPGDRGLRLKAQGIVRDLYYRMDAIRPAGSHSYHWPSDVLSAQRVTADRIGILGWTRYPVGGTDQDVYVPLRITQHAPAPPFNAVDLVLFPTVELKEVYLTIAAVGDDGRPLRALAQGDSLGYGYYPAERPVRVKLRQLRDPGLYYVEIAAALASGGSFTVGHWVFRGR